MINNIQHKHKPLLAVCSIHTTQLLVTLQYWQNDFTTIYYYAEQTKQKKTISFNICHAILVTCVVQQLSHS